MMWGCGWPQRATCTSQLRCGSVCPEGWCCSLLWTSSPLCSPFPPGHWPQLDRQQFTDTFRPLSIGFTCLYLFPQWLVLNNECVAALGRSSARTTTEHHYLTQTHLSLLVQQYLWEIVQSCVPLDTPTALWEKWGWWPRCQFCWRTTLTSLIVFERAILIAVVRLYTKCCSKWTITH